MRERAHPERNAPSNLARREDLTPCADALPTEIFHENPEALQPLQLCTRPLIERFRRRLVGRRGGNSATCRGSRCFDTRLVHMSRLIARPMFEELHVDDELRRRR